MFGSKESRQRRRTLRRAKDLLHSLRKNRIYARDILKPADLQEARDFEAELAAALKARDAAAVEKLERRIDTFGKRVFPATGWEGWIENVEVIVVAIVIALAIKSYFLQPFKIPTGSMHPTLNGVMLTETSEPFPSLPMQALDAVLFGRSYHDVVTRTGGRIQLEATTGGTFTPWFEYTDLRIGQETIRIWAPWRAIYSTLLKDKPRDTYYPPGASVLRFRMDTGDQLLVNKMAYHFRKPKLGEVFVFVTTGIRGIEINQRRQNPDAEGSQFYIKRCTGLPGDVLAIRPPWLVIDGEKATEPPIFAEIASQQDGYNGYTVDANQVYLNPAGTTYQVPPNGYWAMGDNSLNSEDSRFWGPVPRGNLIGTGFIVYWPFTSHWGWVR